MTWNILAYSLYLLITAYTIFVVGKDLHRNGQPFVDKSFQDEQVAVNVNNVLLLGYYLVNIGYALLTITGWTPIYNWTSLVVELTGHIGLIYLILAILHYNNILCLRLYAHWQGIEFFTQKNQHHGK